jgi:hypothetical protein
MASVKITVPGSTLNYDPPTDLFDTAYPLTASHSGGSFLPYAVSPDGQRFLIPRASAADAGSIPITVILNWSATLKR